VVEQGGEARVDGDGLLFFAPEPPPPVISATALATSRPSPRPPARPVKAPAGTQRDGFTRLR
jgi:hypothetical protein